MISSLPSRVLVFRLGSLGDTIVALPALRLIERAFPNSELWVLTNFPVSEKAPAMASLLQGMGLVKGYLRYSIGIRNIGELGKLACQIRRLHPTALVYLTGARGGRRTIRDAVFFRMCGIKQMVGIPYSADLRRPQRFDNNDYEYEGARLIRNLADLDFPQKIGAEAFNLRLTGEERATAQLVIEPCISAQPFLAASIGSKVDVKDWGDENWRQLLSRLSMVLSGWGLVMVGASDERERSERLIDHWRGARLNLCGVTSVRETAAVLERAEAYIGHDSGPMHLAAAVGTSCVAIFSSRDLPGVWFPFGGDHRVLYHSVECRGCRLEVCGKYQKRCIRSITVDEVGRAVLSLPLQAHTPAKPPTPGVEQDRRS